MADRRMPPAQVYIKVGDLEVKGDVVNMTRIDSDNILQELVDHPANYAYLATMNAMAQRELTHLKRDRDRLSAELYADIKKKATDDGAKFTETGAEKEINKVPAYQQLLDDITEAEYRVSQLSALCTAFQMRKDLLVQVAMHCRSAEGSIDQRAHDEVQNAKRRKA